jgi:teichuronic acid biosynthesis glycosyltransferase TuaG
MISVTVIIPFFNSCATIERAILSCLNQTSLPKKILIIDDFSRESERKKLLRIVNFFKKKLNITILSTPKNLGPGSARNVGWNFAKTKYIAFLDADDSWHHKKLEIQYSLMERHSLLISAHKATINFDDTFKIYNFNYNFKYINLLRFLLSNQFTTPSVMLRSNIEFRFKEKKFYTEDYLLWLRLLINNYKIALFDCTMTYIHKPLLGFSGLSGNITNMRRGEQDTYHNLYKEKLINFFTYLLLLNISKLKSLRQWFLK